MRAMILAAGRGERMRPLTDACPKPLLPVGSRPLIGWHLSRLAAAGIRDVVINTAWLGEQIETSLGEGTDYGVRLHWSREGTALETAGGIATALPLLGDAPFVVINGDVLTDADLAPLIEQARQLDGRNRLTHLLLVANPEHNPAGDFSLSGHQVGNAAAPRYTFSGLGAYHPALFRDLTPWQPAKLGPLLKEAAARGAVSGSVHTGTWLDVGTVERLEQARDWVARHWDNPR